MNKVQLIRKIKTRTTAGVLSKGIYEIDGRVYIVKGATSGHLEPFSEVLGSRIFDSISGLPTVSYTLSYSNHFPEIRTGGLGYVSICEKIPFTVEKYHDFVEGLYLMRNINNKYAGTLESYLELGLSKEFLYRMFICDAFIGNTDRHWNNFDVANNRGRLVNAPVLDFGASLLFDVYDEDLKPKLLIGEDRAKPLRETHREQIDHLRRIWGTPKYFNVDKKMFLRWFVQYNQDILRLMSNKRVMTLLRYLDRRFDLYIQPYNIA